MAARGSGAADIAYLVTQGLPTEVREDATRRWFGSTSISAVRRRRLRDSTRLGAITVTRSSYLMVLPVDAR